VSAWSAAHGAASTRPRRPLTQRGFDPRDDDPHRTPQQNGVVPVADTAHGTAPRRSSDMASAMYRSTDRGAVRLLLSQRTVCTLRDDQAASGQSLWQPVGRQRYRQQAVIDGSRLSVQATDVTPPIHMSRTARSMSSFDR
jgi:hypothetical protein